VKIPAPLHIRNEALENHRLDWEKGERTILFYWGKGLRGKILDLHLTDRLRASHGKNWNDWEGISLKRKRGYSLSVLTHELRGMPSPSKTSPPSVRMGERRRTKWEIDGMGQGKCFVCEAGGLKKKKGDGFEATPNVK